MLTVHTNATYAASVQATMTRPAPGITQCLRRAPRSAGGATAAALGATAEEIAATRFRPGTRWVWLYRDGKGLPSSWERYTVRSSAGEELVIDMATKFGAGETYSTHHSMRLRLTQGLAAVDAPGQWSFLEFAFFDPKAGRWRAAPHTNNVQAFEEKFCLFMMTDPGTDRLIADRKLSVAGLGPGRATVVQSRRHAYTAAWYVQEPVAHAGVAAFKAFGPEGGEETFTFELVEVHGGAGEESEEPEAGPTQ